MVCIDLYHSRLLSFIEILIKAYPTAAKCTYYVEKLDNFWWNLVKFCQMTWKSAANYLYTICLNGNFTMSKVEWVETSEISIISPSSLMTFDQINIG